MFKREKNRFSIRKNKRYGACSVFLGLIILTLAVTGGDVNADVVTEPLNSSTNVIAESPVASPEESSAVIAETSKAEQPNTPEVVVSNEATDGNDTPTPRSLTASQVDSATSPSESATVVGNNVDASISVFDADLQRVYSEPEKVKDNEVRPNMGGYLNLTFRVTVPKTVAPGDFFTIKHGDYLDSVGNTNPGDWDAVSPDFTSDKGQIIAKGVYDKNTNTSTFTFTDYVKLYDSISGKIDYPQFIDRSKVLNDGTQTVSLTIGSYTLTKLIEVNYGGWQENSVKDNKVTSMITSVDLGMQSNNYEQVIIVNPFGENLQPSDLIVRSYFNQKSDSNGLIDQTKTKIDVYKVKDNAKINHSFYLDDNSNNLEKVKTEARFDNNNSFSLPLDMSGGQAYIVRVKSQYDPKSTQPLQTLVSLKEKNSEKQPYGNWHNTVVRTAGMAEGVGVERPGQFTDHHRYESYDITGKLIDSISVSSQTQESFNNNRYTTELIVKTSYTFDKAEKLVGNPEIATTEVPQKTGNFETAVHKEVTYVYKRQQGRFIENHRYYLDYTDAEGNVLRSELKEASTDSSYGYPTEDYNADVKEKDGFTFTGISEKVGVAVDNHHKVASHYVGGQEHKVTYDYHKKVRDPETLIGSFQDHHRYFDVKKDFAGVEVSRSENETLSFSSPKQTGKADAMYSTQKKEQDDYVFTKFTDDKNNPVVDAQGNLSSGYFEPDVHKEVTYNYEKVEQPGRFQDSHRYFIDYVDANGKVIRSEEATHLALTRDYQEGLPEWEEYTATALEKDGFIFDKVSDLDLVDSTTIDETNGTVRGTYLSGQLQRMTYNYRKQVYLTGQVIATYHEVGTGKELSKAEFATYDQARPELPKGTAVVNDSYTTRDKFIADYELVEQPENATGSVVDGVTYVPYLYQKAPQLLGTVIVRHVEFGTGKEIAPSVYATYDDVPAGVPEGSTVAGIGYETQPVQVEGYDLIEVPENDYGNVVEGITRLTYVYKKQIITGQGEIIDFELESNGDESGQNTQPDEISEHGPIVEMDYPSQESLSGENSGTVEVEDHSPIVELDYPSQGGMSGENAGTVEVEDSFPLVSIDFPNQTEQEEQLIIEKPVLSQEPAVTTQQVKLPEQQSDETKLPVTGEQSATVMTVLGLVLSSLGMITIKRNKKSKQ
ncbi:Ig-like domain-containing protein [Streptococcus dysgalactiae]|uniref:Ig-like domain-containing protein n=1 Tax=Streptococcus dysgalactiae TaxID=1334 RepID=UPI003D9FC7C7